MVERFLPFACKLVSYDEGRRHFGGVRALTDISFDIRKGEVYAITKRSGKGKSSMLNCINGFYHPQQGSITYKGVRRSQMKPYAAGRQGIGRTFQNIALSQAM